MNTVDVVHITKHQGKMEGILSVSTSTLNNPFCQSHPEQICDFCYARKLESIRPSLHSYLAHNSELLSTVLPDTLLPRFARGSFVRFNSFGELINEHHVENLVRICELNPDSRFTLWTKRVGLLPKDLKKKPPNYKVVYSWGPLDPPLEWLEGIIRTWPWIDHVFAVYTKDSPAINCQSKCKDCLICYKEGTEPRMIRELLRNADPLRPVTLVPKLYVNTGIEVDTKGETP